MKNLTKLYAIILIILGSFLEAFYYTQNFNFDGVPLIISIIIAIALTVALTLLSSYFKKPFIWLLIIPLAIFSIYITSSGQAAYLQNSEKTENIEISQEQNKQDQLDYYLNEIDILNNDLEILNKQITVTTTWARNKYGDAVESVEERQDEIRTEKRILQEKVESLRSDLISNVEIKQFIKYDLYEDIFDINVKIKQFITHVLLSFFIAILAPIGIIILTVNIDQSVKKKKVEPQKEKVNYDKYVRRWVEISWTPKRKNSKVNNIINKNSFLNYWQTRFKKGQEKFDFPEKTYNLIKNAAIAVKCVDKKDIIVNNYTEDQVISLVTTKLRS